VPLTLKSFVAAEPLSVEEVAAKLRGYGIYEAVEVGGREVQVGFGVPELRLERGELVGRFEESFVATLRYRGEELQVPVTVQTEFRFQEVGGRLFLTVAARKARANRVASRLSAAVAAGRRRGVFLEALIPEGAFRGLYESRPQSVRVVVFTDVRLPDVGKLTLYGSQLASSGLYSEYLRLGRVWYVVFETERGHVVGLTRNCIVTFFSRVDPEEAYEYVRSSILPLAAGEGEG